MKGYTRAIYPKSANLPRGFHLSDCTDSLYKLKQVILLENSNIMNICIRRENAKYIMKWFKLYNFDVCVFFVVVSLDLRLAEEFSHLLLLDLQR